LGITIPDYIRVRVTEIQFKTYLSYNILKEYLIHLLENDLIEYIEGERTFKTTPRGMQALQVFNKMDELFVPKSTSGVVELPRIYNLY
jgi:predicted transcriptional regulator